MEVNGHFHASATTHSGKELLVLIG